MCTTARIVWLAIQQDAAGKKVVSKRWRTSLLTCALVVAWTNALQSQQSVGVGEPDLALVARPADRTVRTVFTIKYVAQDTVYINAGRTSGLASGMKLEVKRVEDDSQTAATSPTVGELEVISVADASAICNVLKASVQLQRGDTALLSDADADALVQRRSLSGTRAYPQVITFTEGDPLEEEVRDGVPRPQMAEVNRMRGRIGFDYSGTSSHSTIGSSSSQVGVVFRADISRIAGTYWNLSGYWRGRLNQSAPEGQQSIQDLLNRTYHLSLTYDSPNSRWVAGVGRLYLPWANSLDTLDGGYFGRRLSKIATAGLFAGSTPDPTSWSYNPDRRIAGAFVNFTGGSFDHVHYSSTSGLALSALKWQLDRPFVFFENNISYRHYVSIYHSLQADDPKPAAGQNKVGAGISRSYLTLRFSPHPRVSFDINHNYFRDVPTFDTRLIGTGLLDKYLFQGLSAGVRVETWRRITLYTNLGRSNRTGDTKQSWNQMYGVSTGQIWRTGLRADVRYSQYDSSFGRGNYRSLSLSRSFLDKLRMEIQAGRQSLVSSITSQSGSRFLSGMFDANLGSRFFFQGGFTAERGSQFDYNQWTTTLGYRFDSHTTKVERP